MLSSCSKKRASGDSKLRDDAGDDARSVSTLETVLVDKSRSEHTSTFVRRHHSRPIFAVWQLDSLPVELLFVTTDTKAAVLDSGSLNEEQEPLR